MNPAALLGRAVREYPLPDLQGKVVVVTGGRGGIGRFLTSAARELGAVVYTHDLPTHDVTHRSIVRELKALKPDLVFHLAAHKHAPRGEELAFETQHVNIEGTGRVLQSALKHTRIIVASTCKAADPETVYGASKLIAERLTLNADQTVGRLYNVIESRANVFDLWADQWATTGRIRVTPCHRYFVSMTEAASFLLSLVDVEPGRYAPNPGQPIYMVDMAMRWLIETGADIDPHEPSAHIEMADRRRGDRRAEPLWAKSEKGTADQHGRIVIVGEHDRVPQLEPA